MATPVLTFFNSKGGVGKTSLVYHLTWMLSLLGVRVLACDLDPQANLTALFLGEDELESLWEDGDATKTIHQAVKPLTAVGDIKDPRIHFASDTLGLVPGDLALSSFEDNISSEWPNALGEKNLYRPFRIATAFWQVMQKTAESMNASIILVDVGPNLGALNRSALIATDYIIAPLAADIWSLQGLRNLGPTLRQWRSEWKKRRENWNNPEFELPSGAMQPIGYLVQQHSVRLGRPVKAYDKWAKRIPEAYARYLLNHDNHSYPNSPTNDINCVATVRHYRSLVAMAQEARKPIFLLTQADGAIGGHSTAVSSAYEDFRRLADSIQKRAKFDQA